MTKSHFFLPTLLTLLALAGFAAPAAAQTAAPAAKPAAAPAAKPSAAPSAKPDVESVLVARKVELDAEKKERLIEASTAKPGELIEYRVTYTNKGQNAVRDVLATLPIPADTVFQRAGVVPAGARASLGDGKFAAIPLKRKVKLPSGKEEEIDIPLSEYRAIQWSLGELAAGKSVVVAARVRVSDAPNTAPPSATPPTPAGPPSAKGGQK
jgi:uncharacterized repeat protein (TIGR01451 family)